MKNLPEPSFESVLVPVYYDHPLVQLVESSPGVYEIEQRQDFDDILSSSRSSGVVRRREFVLLCFHRTIHDHDQFHRSELLCKLDELGLKPEGLYELLAIMRCYTGDFCDPIIARGYLCPQMDGSLLCPVYGNKVPHGVLFRRVTAPWSPNSRFLTSRK